jgi:hypothetical protein
MSFQIQFAEIAKQDLRDIWRGSACLSIVG